MIADARALDSAPSPSVWTRTHRLVAATTVLIGLVGSVVFYAGPADAKPDVWMATTGLLLASMYAGVFCFRRDHLRPWLLVMAGLTSAWLAMFLMNYGSWFGLSFGAPSVLDALMLANYPLAALGALRMMSRAHVRTGLHALLETATLTVAGGLLIFVSVGLRAADAATSTAATIVATLYPLGNVLLLAVLATLAVRLQSRPAGLLLVALGFVGNLAADLVSTWQKIEGTYTPGGLVDFGWMLCFIGISLAPSWPEGDVLQGARDVEQDRGQTSFGRTAILFGAVLGAVVALIAPQFQDSAGTRALATIGAVVVFALVLGRVALYTRELRIKEAELLEANLQLAAADADKRSLLWRLNRAVEEERRRIAADIHDHPVQRLAAVSYKVETVSLAMLAGDLTRAADLNDEVADELSDQVAALRTLMTEVRPPVLDERGLYGALKDAATSFLRAHPGLPVTVTGEEIDLEDEVETVLYRVTQEALSNVSKHASAGSVLIELRHCSDEVCLAITDDGKGFDATDWHRHVRDGHYGLAGMRERMAMIGGVMCVDASPGVGTTISFTVPRTADVPLLDTAGVN